jgi:hypothetical protein
VSPLFPIASAINPEVARSGYVSEAKVLRNEASKQEALIKSRFSLMPMKSTVFDRTLLEGPDKAEWLFDVEMGSESDRKGSNTSCFCFGEEDPDAGSSCLGEEGLDVGCICSGEKDSDVGCICSNGKDSSASCTRSGEIEALPMFWKLPLGSKTCRIVGVEKMEQVCRIAEEGICKSLVR